MDFIIDNYIWFGIAGVVLLMALIGFLAEKTNFIAKAGETKNKKGNEETPIVNSLPVEEYVQPTNNEVTDSTEVSNDTVVPKDVVSNEDTVTQEPVLSTESGVDPMFQTVQNDTAQTTSVPEQTEVVTETGEDLTQPFGEAIVAPTEEAEPVSDASPVETQVTPEASNVDNKAGEVVKEEDIWKF